MKLSLLLHYYNDGGGRRSNSLRSAHQQPTGPDSGVGAVEGVFRSPAALFWLALHAVCCVISLLLGFRFSRLLFFLLFTYPTSSPTVSTLLPIAIPLPTSASHRPPPQFAANRTASRLVVGRHVIRVRPWPRRPNPAQVVKAHRLMEVVQREQRVQYGVKSRRPLIVVTPTHVRTFQTVHLTGLAHTLMLLPYELTWIVVEAGGPTNETAAIINKSGLNVVHLPFDGSMPVSWLDRRKLEALMRIHALRY